MNIFDDFDLDVQKIVEIDNGDVDIVPNCATVANTCESNFLPCLIVVTCNGVC